MNDSPPPQDTRPHLSWGFQTNLIAGVLTILPLAVVYVIVDFVLQILSDAGKPFIKGLASWVSVWSPAAAGILLDNAVQAVLAVIVVICFLYLLGLVATQVVGARLIDYVERLIARIPFVTQIYGATKKLVGALQQKPDGVQRVVLIAFPHPGMRAIGLVMRTFRDGASGQELAAVFVPTTPNPTSGYLEIVPVADCVPTAMTMDEAMSMIMSGGAVAPDSLAFVRAAPAAQAAPGAPASHAV